MNVDPPCECSTGKRPLDIRMTLKYIVKKKNVRVFVMFIGPCIILIVE